MLRKKRTIAETGVVDLRKHTPEALKKIKKIMCAGMVILPEKPSAEFMEAFSDIQLTATGLVFNLADNAEFKSINGSGFLTGNIDENTIYQVNGSCIIHSVKSEAPIKMIVNGMVIYEEGTDIDFLHINGRTVSVNRSLADCVSYNRDMEINGSVIRNYKKGTVVVAGHDLMLTSDITEEMLSEKDLYFIAGHDIKCTKDIYGYSAANSTAGHEIKV